MTAPECRPTRCATQRSLGAIGMLLYLFADVTSLAEAAEAAVDAVRG
jgi:hypothetical protein